MGLQFFRMGLSDGVEMVIKGTYAPIPCYFKSWNYEAQKAA